MKLYQGWRSSASWRVRWALALKRVEYQSVWVDLEAGEHHEVVTPVNPFGSVPTLLLGDGTALSDSVAIIEWLEETIPEPPLLPKGPLARAHVRELVQLVTANIHPLQNGSVRRAVSDDPEKQAEWCRRWIARGLEAYEKHLQHRGGRYSAGDELTMADLYLVPQVRNAERYGLNLDALPKVQAIYRRCLELPEAQRTQPLERHPGR